VLLFSQDGKPKPGYLGPFDKKWLMIAVQDLEHQGKEPLGRVVVNLSDFASEDGRATQAFTVACTRSISAAVGEAKLLVTIGWGISTSTWLCFPVKVLGAGQVASMCVLRLRIG
jgi:hypothetical protein